MYEILPLSRDFKMHPKTSDYASSKFGSESEIHRKTDYGVFYLVHGTDQPIHHFDHSIKMAKCGSSTNTFIINERKRF